VGFRGRPSPRGEPRSGCAVVGGRRQRRRAAGAGRLAVARQSGQRPRLALLRPTEPPRQWPLPRALDGQGSWRRIRYQRDGLGPRSSERLGLLRRRGGRQIVELSVGTQHLPPHGGLARPTGSSLPRLRWSSVRRALTRSPRHRHGVVKGAESVGIPSFDSNNGRMMEGDGGASICDVRVRNGLRQSAFRSYVAPYLERPNLTVLPHALITRLTLRGNRVTGVEFHHRGKTRRVRAGSEVIVSLGAIHTPKLLMQSGIGDADELRRFGIPVTQHLPGVGQNFQDHVLVPCIWEYRQQVTALSPESYATLFWNSDEA